VDIPQTDVATSGDSKRGVKKPYSAAVESRKDFFPEHDLPRIQLCTRCLPKERQRDAEGDRRVCWLFDGNWPRAPRTLPAVDPDGMTVQCGSSGHLLREKYALRKNRGSFLVWKVRREVFRWLPQVCLARVAQ
jgi:hypothetical protein